MSFNRAEHKKVWNRNRARRNTALIARWKKIKGCASCGFKEHHAALVLDHIDPSTKDRNKRTKSYNPLWKKDRIKKELTKCQVLCANCHHVRTYEEEHFKHDRLCGVDLGSTGSK